MFFFGFFGGFYRCGSATFPNFRGGTSSPPKAAKCVRTILRIADHKGKVNKSVVAERGEPKLFDFSYVVRPAGIEPATISLKGSCSTD